MQQRNITVSLAQLDMLICSRRTAKSTTKERNREIVKELEKMLVEKASKKKIAEFVKKLKGE